MKIRSIAAAAALAVSPMAQSQYGLEVSIGSHHICTGKNTECGDFREFNPGAFLRYDITESGEWVAMTGAYLNSGGNTSSWTAIAAVERTWHVWGPVLIGMAGGIASGYYMFPVPAVLPRLHIGPVVATIAPFPEVNQDGEANGSWGIALGFSIITF